MSRSTAAGVIIGNEVLTAKVADQNGPLLTQRLRARGVPLKGLWLVPDEIDAIVDAVTSARQRASHVFTSGGIGPTHDDVTVRAVALALGRRIVRVPEIESRLRAKHGDEVPPEVLRLAEAPEGYELLPLEGGWFPALFCDGVFMLPGVPQLFRLQLEVALGRVEGTPLQLKQIYLSVGEGEIAAALDKVALAAPDVAIGSYPTFDRSAGYHVKLTVEHAEAAKVDAVVGELLRVLPSGSVLRVEP